MLALKIYVFKDAVDSHWAVDRAPDLSTWHGPGVLGAPAVLPQGYYGTHVHTG